MLIYLIRHGQTNYNKQSRLQGQTDIDLNEQGRLLAGITGEALKNVKFDYVISSPLTRAMETARIIIREKEVPIIAEARVQEIGFGDYEGLCFGIEGYNIPNPNFKYFFTAPEQYQVPPHGESFDDIIKRTGEFLHELINTSEFQNKTILVSTHGCALKAILANIRKVPVSEFWGEGVHKNCAVSIINAQNGKIEIVEEGKIYYS